MRGAQLVLSYEALYFFFQIRLSRKIEKGLCHRRRLYELGFGHGNEKLHGLRLTPSRGEGRSCEEDRDIGPGRVAMGRAV
jgi:hypothetical protein